MAATPTSFTPSTARLEIAYPSGGYHETNAEMLAKQRVAVMGLIKGFGTSLVNLDVSLSSVTLPVEVFEPRSFLQKCIDWLKYSPHLLSPTAKQNDPVERMKGLMATVISGCWLSVRQDKPFNPILGETWQAVFAEDGSRVFCEQVAHHPPVTHWEVVGDGFHLHGYGEVISSFRGNSIKAYQVGKFGIDFDDGSSIAFSLPVMWLTGMVMGDRVVTWEGSPTFVDASNGLIGSMTFNPDGATAAGATAYLSSWFSTPRVADTVVGWIARGEPPGDWETRSTAITTEDAAIVSRLSANWLGWVDFDGRRYWDIRNPSQPPLEPVPVAEPLPSDCRYRDDLVALLAGDIDAARVQKDRLEQKQRKEAKWRKAGAAAQGQPAH